MLENEEIFKELPEDLRNRFLEIFKDFGNIEEFETIKGKSIIDLMAVIMKESLKFFQDKQKLREFLNIVPDLILNYDKLIINSYIVDKEHYLDILNMLRIGYQFHKDKTIEICNSYISTLQSKYPIQKITYNILLFRDFAPNLYEVMENTPINEYEEKVSSLLFEMIKNNQEDQFQYYFFDWALKFGYLIEAYIKEFLISQLKLKCLLKNEDFNKIADSNKTIGQLLKTLRKENTLATIRNAIFHTSFIIDYHIDFDKRKIIFKDLKGKTKNLDINEFVGSYFKLFQLVQTELYALSFFIIKIYGEQLKFQIQNQIDSILQIFENAEIHESLSTNDSLDKFTEELKKILKSGMGFD